MPCAKVSASRLAELERPGPAKAAIRRYFRQLVDFSAGDERRLGCPPTNSAIAMAPGDVTIEARLQRSFAAVAAAFFALSAAARREARSTGAKTRGRWRVFWSACRKTFAY